jgi:hypothetical protein
MEDITIRGRGKIRGEFYIYIRELAQSQDYHEAGDANTKASREQRGVIEEGWTR